MPLIVGAWYKNKYENFAKLIAVWDDCLALVCFESMEFGLDCFGLLPMSNLAEEKFSSPYDKTVRGTAFLGAGPYSPSVHSDAYRRWSAMIDRVVNANFDHKPCYMGVGISNEFLDFQKFAKWFYDQLGHDKDKYQLDKDLLSSPGLVMYSPETCCFLPARINSALPRFVNKEQYQDFVSALAEKYKDEISEKAFSALLNYYQ